jgi:hypothetical protein
MHKKVKQYRCNVCFIKYVWKTAAERCEAMHTGERNVKCEYCSKRFYTKAQKISHRAVAHHKVVEMSCEHCDFIGHSLRELKQHFSVEHADSESE